MSLALSSMGPRQTGQSNLYWRAVLAALTMLLLLAPSPAAVAQTSESAGRGGGDGLVVPLPAELPDGRVVRPIGVFQSQLVELIPDNYEAVSLDSLREAISQLVDDSRDDQTSRLRSSVYWVRIVDGTLVSDRSVIDIETDREGLVRRSLGRTNLAIEIPQRRDIATPWGLCRDSNPKPMAPYRSCFVPAPVSDRGSNSSGVCEVKT